MPMVDIDDTTLYYERDGEGPAAAVEDAEAFLDMSRTFAVSVAEATVIG